MKILLSILSVYAISLHSCRQNAREYNFQDIGLHIKIPDGYLIQDSFPTPNFVDINGRQITDSTKLKNLAADLMKGLLVLSSPDHKNTISLNIALETPKTGNFEQYYDFSKNMQQLLAKQQLPNYDTFSSILKVGNISIHKFQCYSSKTNPIQYSDIYLAQVKKYFLVIKADYVSKTFSDDFEKIMLTSKFD